MALETKDTLGSPNTLGRAQHGRSDGDAARQELEIRGLDALESVTSTSTRTRSSRALWAWTWPKLAAIALALLLWQVVVWSGRKPSYVLPGPVDAFGELATAMGTGDFWKATGITLTRGLVGFGISAVVGLVLGVAVAQSNFLRAAIGSMITGLQTMPSIAWFPLAILPAALPSIVSGLKQGWAFRVALVAGG